MLRLLAIGLAVMSSLVACGGGKSKPPDPPPTDMTQTEPAKTEPDQTAADQTKAPEPPPAKPEPPKEPPNTTDSDLNAIRSNLAEHTWKPVPSLPKGAQMAVLEGEPPFNSGKSFAFLLKFPKNYKVPPHTHLVTERVTVLSGALNFGHGEKFDKTKTKEIKQGGIVLIPAGHAHYVWNKNETVVHLSGTHAWGIYYIDPKDDPRKPAVAKPEAIEHATDSEIAATEKNTADVEWKPGPPSLPAGAEISVLEGAPPFPGGKSFVFRLKFPTGYKIPVHHHLVTERVLVLSGNLKFGMGEKWNDADLKPMKAGGVVYMPREHKHFVQAEGETIVQLQGVGPWGIIYANPDEDPRKKK